MGLIEPTPPNPDRVTDREAEDLPRDVDSVPCDAGPRRPIVRVTGPREPRFQAVIKRSVLEAMHDHGKTTIDVEICGVMVGKVHHDANGLYLLVHGSIAGEQAANKETQVTFTAETWTAIQATMDRDFPGDRIVGWYHTHPGFGVFLSGMDLFIQENFFNLPWQVALVYDPIANDDGLFVWRQGKSERDVFLIEEDAGEFGHDWRGKLNSHRRPAALNAGSPVSKGGRHLLVFSIFLISFVVTFFLMKYWPG